MSESALTKAQEDFLEECALEFSDRFTDTDLDYKKIYDYGIPQPPIMSPWYGRGRFDNRDRDRDRGGGRRYNDHGSYRGGGGGRYNDHDRNQGHHSHGRDSHHQNRFRPY